MTAQPIDRLSPGDRRTLRSETPAERITREWADRPRPDHWPHAYARERLALLPHALNATAADVNAVRTLDLELVEAQAAIERLPDPASDPRRHEHADARAALDAWLAPLHDDLPDRHVELPHAAECSGAEHETSDHRAPTPYGVTVVRVRRCALCGVQRVVNRRVVVPRDQDAERRQLALEQRESARRMRAGPRMPMPARTSKFAA